MSPRWWPFGRRRQASGDPTRVAEVEALLGELRPRLRADGGDVRLRGVDGGRVRLELRGACRSCAAQVLTLKGAVEPLLRERLAWFEGLDA